MDEKAKNELIKKIATKADVSEEKVLSIANEQIELLNGLLTIEPALLFAANKLGVELKEDEVIAYIPIKDLKTGINEGSIKASVRWVGELKDVQSKTEKGTYQSFGILISDTEGNEGGIFVNATGKNVDKIINAKKGNEIVIRDFILKEYTSNNERKRKIVIHKSTYVNIKQGTFEGKSLNGKEVQISEIQATLIDDPIISNFKLKVYVSNLSEVKQDKNGKDYQLFTGTDEEQNSITIKMFNKSFIELHNDDLIEVSGKASYVEEYNRFEIACFNDKEIKIIESNI